MPVYLVRNVLLVLLAVLLCPLLTRAQDAPAPLPNPAPAAAGEKYLLKFQFKPGQVVRYEVIHEGEITTQYNEVTEVAKNKSQSKKHYEVKAAHADGAGDLELTIDWVHMEASQGNSAPIVFKSDESDSVPKAYQALLKAIGQPQATIRFSAAGEILKVEAATKANQATVAKANSSTASPESYLIPLPTQPISVGESWKERFEVEITNQDRLPIKVSMLRTYKLEQVQAGRAMIEFRTSILTPIDDAALAAQLIQRETNGKIVFDLQEGILLSRTSGVDRTVLNPFGQKSSMRAVSVYRERVLPPDETAAKPGKTVN